jgi:putative DNA methylase
MRLGCEVTAADINPVAWFILKCTLEYPQRLAGQTRPLPDFALHDRRLHGGVLQEGQGHDARGGRVRHLRALDKQGAGKKSKGYARGENLELFDAPELTPGRCSRPTSPGMCAPGAAGC